MPQTAMSSKNPFTPTTQVSPTKSASYRLRWHNSVAEDYSPVTDNGGGTLKRCAMMAMPETGVDYPDQLPIERNTTPPKMIPQTKKRKQSASSSIVSTPMKLKQALEGSFDPLSASGIQTPPPTNPTGKKRRGRPPKNQPSVGTSQIEFVNEQATNGTGSHDTTPSKNGQPGVQTGSFVAFPDHGLQGGGLEAIGDDFGASRYWETSFAGSFVSDAGHVSSNFTTMAGEIDIVAATSTFDWSMLPTTMGDSTDHGVMDPLRPLSMHTSLADSFFHDSTPVDPLNFSFAQDPLSASDIISPVSVDPNLIFSGQSMARNYSDHIGASQPYHQQSLQQHQQHGQQRKRDKTIPTKTQTRTVPKVAAPSASNRPGMKRALTESALIKSTGASRTSNVTVHPSPVKQMGSSSGKIRPTIRDENTTPSPSIGTASVPQVSPQSCGTKRSSRKVKTAVSFSISPGGRAKAERVVVREPETHSEREDSEHDREEYDTDSSTDEDDFGPMQSRYSMAARRAANSKGRHGSSSSFSRSMERPKLARFKTAPSNSFSTSSQFLMSGDFTSDSFSLDNNPFLPPNLSMSSFSRSPRKKSSHSRRHSKSSSFHSVRSAVAASNATGLGSMREEDEYSEAETVVDEPTYKSPGDAILARDITATSLFIWHFSPIYKTY
ncbi:hypothetical protein ABW19_dt0207489 [Dactylella cylindrospora]|nr:hypothetical protein ABW19_dt0207489 [Dactylella cylindrospora]